MKAAVDKYSWRDLGGMKLQCCKDQRASGADNSTLNAKSLLLGGDFGMYGHDLLALAPLEGTRKSCATGTVSYTRCKAVVNEDVNKYFGRFEVTT